MTDRCSTKYHRIHPVMEKHLVSLNVDQSLTYVGIGRFHYVLIAVAALLKATEGVEIYILSIIDPLLRCAWSISSLQGAVLTVLVFVGMFFGGPIWGSISDFYGRRKTLLITSSAVIFYGILSGLSPTFSWIVFLRMVLGFFLNGLLISTIVYVTELTPLKSRGKVLILLFCSWPIGGILTAAFAHLTVESLGWRGVVVSSVISLFIPSIFVCFLPSSPHFLMTIGKESEALAVIDKISRINGRGQFPFGLTLTGVAGSSQLRELFSPKFKTTFLCLLILYLGQGIVYVGHVFMVVLLPMYEHNCLQNVSIFSKTVEISHDISCCVPLSSQTYYNIAFASIGEICSIFFTLPSIDLIGRRFTILLNGIMGSIAVLLLSLCVSQPVYSFLFIISRSFVGGYTMTLLLYTVEVFPTTVRNFGTGVCQMASFFGSICTPFIAQIMIPNGYGFQAILLYSCCLFLTVMCICVLPVETKGRPLTDTSAENELNYHDIPLLTSRRSCQKSRDSNETHFATGANETGDSTRHYGALQ